MSPPTPALTPIDDYPKGLPAAEPPIVGNGLKDVFDRYFRVVPADTDALREHCYRLRYRVYCVENDFEPASQNPGGLETDVHDSRSLHSLLVHGEAGAVVGAVRLILSRDGGDAVPLPIRRVCSAETLAACAHRLPLDRAAEISRFAITRQFRRRVGEMDTLAGPITQIRPADAARLIPHISLGLMQAVVAMAIEGDVSHLCAMMEPTLLRMLDRLGICFEHMGPPVEYHGHRQPCFCDIEELRETLYLERPDVWSVLTDDGRLRDRGPVPITRRTPAGTALAR